MDQLNGGEMSDDQEWTKVEFMERERTPYTSIPTPVSIPNVKQRMEHTPGSFPAESPTESTGFSSSYSNSQRPPGMTGQAPPTTGSSTQGQDPAGGNSRPLKPRKCRICLEVVWPTVSPSAIPSIPGIAPQPPRWVYEDPELGRLISPCKCKGSSKYVHQGCLQQWRLAAPLEDRNYWRCPTCGYNYRLDRLTWAANLQSVPSQLVLTLFLFVVAMFIMGFIADPIINIYLDPWSIFGLGWTGTGPLEPIDHVWDDEGPDGWFEHFFKGMASLGVLGFLKFMITSPLYFWRTRLGVGGGNGRQATGRDRMENLSWIMIIIGIGTTLYGIYTAVRLFSRRALARTAESVLDVGGDQDDGDDD